MRKYCSTIALSTFLLLITAGLMAQRTQPYHTWHYETSYLSSQQGLPQNSAYAMHQDAFGFVWIATQIGIARYDGHIFTDYPFKDLAGTSSDPTSYERFLCEFTVMAEDTLRHTLWIGSCAGLFGISTETYETWQFVPLQGTPIRSIHVMPNSDLLVGSQMGLLELEVNPNKQSEGKTRNLFQRELGKHVVLKILSQPGKLLLGTSSGVFIFTRPQNTANWSLSSQIPGDYIRDILLLEAKNELWVAEYEKTHIYDLTTGNEIQTIPQAGVNFFAFHASPPAFAVPEIILGTEYAGLIAVDPDTRTIKSSPGNERFNLVGKLRGNQAHSYLVTRDKAVWIGTRGMGITRLVLQKEAFAHHFKPFQLPDRVPNNYVWAIYRENSEDSIVWLGTEGNGLTRYNLTTQQPTAFYDVSPMPRKNIVRTISKGRKALWLGGFGGLHYLNLEAETPALQQLNHLFPPGLDPAITSLYFDVKHDCLWVGTMRSGLCIYDPATQIIRRVPTGAGMLINYIGPGTGDSIVVASNRGFVQFSAGNALAISQRTTGPVYLQNEHVKCMVPGQKSTLAWVGTVGNGLIQLSHGPKGEVETRAFLPKDGLPDPVVYGILPAHAPGDPEEFWLSTNRGLSKFYPDFDIFINYGEEDNLQHSEFNTGAFFRTGTTFHFGGVNGFNAFDRSTPETAPYLPPLALAYFIADTSGKDEKILLFDAAPDAPPAIQLKYDYPYIEFRMLSLHYQDFGKVNYKYRLYPKGAAPPEWTMQQGEPNFILSAGNGLQSSWLFPQQYILEVSASNLLGGFERTDTGQVGSRQLRILISVRPPYWQTWWFLLSLLLIGLLIGILAVNLKRQNSKLRYRNQDLQTAYTNTAALADLNQIGQKVVASLRLEENIGTIMEEIRDLRDLRSDVFAIDLLDTERHVLESRLSIEDGKRLDSYAVSMDNPDSLGVACVRLALAGGPQADGFIINDLADRSQYPFLKGKPGVKEGRATRATLFVPMRVGKQVLGVITVQSYEPDVYSAYQLNMLQILGAYTAIAIDHSRATEARLGAERARTRAEQDDLIKSLDIKLLRSQLSPHFIFNSLGTIQYLVSEGDPRADEYTSRLGEIMREVMMMITQSDVSLETEAEFLRRYVLAERIRFRNEYEFHFCMELAADLTDLEVRIAPMLLQPFIENSLEHAFYPLPKDARPEIRVFFGLLAEHLVIVVQDNGVGLAHTQDKKTQARPRKISTAMENIRRRAELINQLNKDVEAKMEIRAFDLNTTLSSELTLVETWDLPLFSQGARFELHIPLSFKFSASTFNE